MDLKRLIRDVPDYPKPGILFRDLTPLMAHPPAMRYVTDKISEHLRDVGADAICAIDARGFIFASPVAVNMGLPLIPVRKAGKLPPEVIGADYLLEYGDARIEARADALQKDQRVAIVDDLLATGGTAAAAGKLCEMLGAKIVSYSFVVELTFLDGRANLDGNDVFRLVEY